MTHTPTPAANSSHAAAPVVHIPDERLARSIHEPATRRAIEARLNADAHLQKLRVIPDLTWRDDLADLWDDIRSQPLSHAVVGVFGFIVGTFGILALAELAVRL
jgi:hypothetical protein